MQYLNYLNYLNFKTTKYDLINKFYYIKTKNIPKLEKIILNLNTKSLELRKLASSLLALKIISFKKGQLTLTKKANAFLKIKKASPAGCKTILKNYSMFNFLEKFANKLIKKTKKFNTININKQNKISFSIEIENTFNNFKSLNSNFYFFNDLNNLEITFVIKSVLKYELVFILKAFKLFLKKDKWSSGLRR